MKYVSMFALLALMTGAASATTPARTRLPAAPAANASQRTVVNSVQKTGAPPARPGRVTARGDSRQPAQRPVARAATARAAAPAAAPAAATVTAAARAEAAPAACNGKGICFDYAEPAGKNQATAQAPEAKAEHWIFDEDIPL